MGDEIEVSGSGQPIHRHPARARDFELAIGDPEAIRKVEEHINTHIGTVEIVFHELISDLVHLDVHWVKPAAGRDFHTLITTGMSDRPMTVPPGAEELRFAELLIALPPSWPIGDAEFRDERNYWPIRLLKELARLPHEYDTWLGWGHTLPNGDPPRPYAPGTALCGALVLLPQTTPEAFDRLEVAPGKVVHFYAVYPLYREEMDLKLDRGVKHLLPLLAEHGVTEILDIHRRNLAG